MSPHITQKIATFLIITILAIGLLSAQNADDINGSWLNGSGSAKIRIFKTSEQYFGNISWLRAPNDDNGKPKVDKENPDPARRDRKLIGLLILTGFRYDPSSNSYVDGQIYDPKSGKTYSCKIKFKDKDHLEVRGYIGISLIGRTEVWSRADDEK